MQYSNFFGIGLPVYGVGFSFHLKPFKISLLNPIHHKFAVTGS
jgi:hypothetical protein